ncbi:MAG: NfeD family protein [Micromonosporaceae bacterium]|nr:NfeD family protein [Micromonosporaceae bacterium]
MAAVIWLIVGIGLAVAEVITVDLTLLMLSVGAFAAAGAAFLGGNLLVQVIAFAVVSALTVGVVRPFIRKRITHHPDEAGPMGVAEIEGAVAVVVDRVDADRGLIEVQGDTWTARSFDGTQVMEPGDRVKVVQVKGATALVWKDV